MLWGLGPRSASSKVVDKADLQRFKVNRPDDLEEMLVRRTFNMKLKPRDRLHWRRLLVMYWQERREYRKLIKFALRPNSKPDGF